MIFAEIEYETHDGKLLTIIKALKIWQYYLKDYKYKVFVFINYNNLCYFMNTKNLSSR